MNSHRPPPWTQFPFRRTLHGFVLPLFCLFSLSGCPSVSELEAQYAPTNESNLRDANVRIMKSFHLEPTSAKLIERVHGEDAQRYNPEESNKPKTEPHAQRTLATGLLVQATPGAPIEFTGSGCMTGGSSCGCGREMEYSFAKAKDGTIWVLVPQPLKEVHSVFRVGTCTYGCGVPSPPTPAFRFELPTTDIQKVRGILVEFQYHVARESCTSSMPAP